MLELRFITYRYLAIVYKPLKLYMNIIAKLLDVGTYFSLSSKVDNYPK